MRRTAFAIAENVLPDSPSGLVAKSDFTAHGGADAIARLPDRYPELDAVLVGSDLMACGALHVLGEVGLGVPEDVAVIGSEHLGSFAKTVSPSLDRGTPRHGWTGWLMARHVLSGRTVTR
ncbi:substrate-binding domain-containing protein [Streptomyces sp. NPDC005820]|uniref:substrate-binding domain-containing protein n=1 Tax=Streptomyces sp. NPDC005820 TaxID=3157069 RepID=UPI00340D74DE